MLLDLARRLAAGGHARAGGHRRARERCARGGTCPPQLAAAGVDAVSVSLNAADAATYARVCPSRYGEAAYDAVKEFIRSAVPAACSDVAASAVALPGLSEAACRAVAESLGARFRWRPYDRLGRIEARIPAVRDRAEFRDGVHSRGCRVGLDLGANGA